MPKLTRTFVALPIPDVVVRQLAHLQRNLARRSPEIRWVESTGFHATLNFLGDVVDVDLNQVCKTVGEVVKEFERFEVTASGIGAFPNPVRPRVVWAGLTDEGNVLTQLHEAIAQALGKIGFRCEESRFHPHVTLGRSRNDRRSPPTDLTPLVEQFREWTGGTFQAREIIVYASELGPKGPTYTSLSQAFLRKRMSGSNP